jgi:hypothetical protein
MALALFFAFITTRNSLEHFHSSVYLANRAVLFNAHIKINLPSLEKE